MHEDPILAYIDANMRKDVILIVTMGVLAVAALIGLQWIADAFG